MRIVIEIDGSKVSVTGAEVAAPGVPAGLEGELAEAVPTEPPPGLLERARKLGAMSAGAARIGTGTALAAVAEAGEAIDLAAARPKTKAARGRRRR